MPFVGARSSGRTITMYQATVRGTTAQAVDLSLQTKMVRHEKGTTSLKAFFASITHVLPLSLDDDVPNARGTCDPLSVAMIAGRSAVKN